MSPSKASVTALLAAFGRAYHARHDSPKIFDDHLAEAHANQFATLYMQYSEAKWAYGGGAPQAIGVKAAGSSETVPWDQTLGDWSDYQALGVNPVSGTILGAWSGDTRDGSTGRIYSTLLQ